MSAPVGRTALALFRQFVRLSHKIPKGVARQRFVRNIHDVFIINQQFARPETEQHLVEKYAYLWMFMFPVLIPPLSRLQPC